MKGRPAQKASGTLAYAAPAGGGTESGTPTAAAMDTPSARAVRKVRLKNCAASTKVETAAEWSTGNGQRSSRPACSTLPAQSKGKSSPAPPLKSLALRAQPWFWPAGWSFAFSDESCQAG